MENTAFEADTEKNSVELKDVKVNVSDVLNSRPVQTKQNSCRPEVCRTIHTKYLQEKSKIATNPWDRLKTVFLVGIILLLSLWLLAYIASSRMGLV